MTSNININGKEVSVQQYRNDWALTLMSQGIIVRLSVSRWRAKAPLSHHELGLRFSDEESTSFMKKYIQLGRENLLPPSVMAEIESIESRSRQALKEFSFPTVWGYFIPYTAFSDWEIINNQIKQEFLDASLKIGEKYDEIIGIVKNDYKSMAKDVWLRLYPNQGEPTASFIEDFISKIVSKIPSRSDIVASFKYDVTYFIIPMPSLIEENLAKAQKTRIEKENKIFENTLEQETKKRISEEYIKRKQELIDGFLEATVAGMRKYISELCDSVLQSLTLSAPQKDMTIPQRNKIKRLIKKVEQLNFHGDKEIAELLKELDIEIDKFKGERDKNIIVVKLQKIIEMGEKEYLPKDFDDSIASLDI